MGDCGASGSDPAAGAQVNYAAAEAPITAAAASETPIADALHGETEYKKASVYPPDRASELAPLLPPLADLAAHYLDTSASEIGERLVNEQNGTVIYRRTARHFAALALEHYGDAYSHADALTAYASERARRDELARQEWSRFFMRLKAMSDGELIAYIAGRCQAEVAELSREGTVFDKHLYRTRLKCARQHLEWRGLKMPDPNPGRRKPIPRKLRPVDMAPAPCVKQAGLFEVAADTGKPNISETPAASGAERRAKPPGWSVKAR